MRDDERYDDDFEDEVDPEDLEPEELLEELQRPIIRPEPSFLAQWPRRESFLSGLLFALAAAGASVAAWVSEPFEAAWIGSPKKIFGEGEWWRLLTSILLHADLKHLLSNLFLLVPFAGLLTNYFGWRVFPVLGLVLGVLTQFLSLKTYDYGDNLLGASGLLYVLFGLWLSLYYRMETQLRWERRFLRMVGFGLVMFIPQEFQPHVSYRTHYIGLAVGLLAGAFWPVRKEKA